MIEDLKNTSIYLQKHLQHNAEEEEEEGKRRKKNLKKDSKHTRSPHTRFTPLHTKHAALELLQYSTIFIILEKAKADKKVLIIVLWL